MAAGSEPLTWIKVEGPTGMLVDASTGRITWTPNEADPVDIVLAVTNPYGQAEQRFTLARAVAEPPRIQSEGRTEAVVGIPYRVDADGYIQVVGVHPDERLELQIGQAPIGFSVNPRTYEVGWMPAETGSFDVQLLLTTPSGKVFDAIEFVVNVSATAPEPPVGALLVSPSRGAAPFEVTLDATASASVFGDLLLFTWDTGDGALARTQGPTLTHVYYQPGSYRARVEVLDAQGQTATADAEVLVTQGNRVPPSVVSSRIPSTGHRH